MGDAINLQVLLAYLALIWHVIDVIWHTLGVIFTLPTAACALTYVGVRTSTRNKQRDIVGHFHDRFDLILDKRAEIKILELDERTPNRKQEIKIMGEVFFERFWGHQFDQFVAWYDGYIPTHLYLYWLFARRRELRNASENWIFDGQTMDTSRKVFEARWGDASTEVRIPMNHLKYMTNFLRLIKDCAENTHLDLESRLIEAGPRCWVRRFRKFIGAY